MIKKQPAYITISMSDVLKHPWFKELSEKPEGLKALLYSMGMDVKLAYESSICTHRSEMTHEIVTCERFVGNERQDEIWNSTKIRTRAA